MGLQNTVLCSQKNTKTTWCLQPLRWNRNYALTDLNNKLAMSFNIAITFTCILYTIPGALFNIELQDNKIMTFSSIYHT